MHAMISILLDARRERERDKEMMWYYAKSNVSNDDGSIERNPR
jgi:hypothetical protein